MKHLLKEEGKSKFLLKDSYLKTIENSVGSKLFRNLYFKTGTKKVDVLENGNLSCAVFVSSILKLFNLGREIHTTVKGAVEDIENSGWCKVNRPKTGAVLVWEEKKFQNGAHKHIGFYISRNLAMSNSLKNKKPAKHHWTYGSKSGKPIRRVTEIWWNKKLGQSPP